MDPDKALTELRQLTMKVLGSGEMTVATDLALAFSALDMWIGRGGFLPSDWQTEDNGCPECHRPTGGGHKMDCSVGRA